MVAIIKRAIEPYEKKKAKERELAGKPSEESAQGKTRDIISNKVGISKGICW
jgi:hypothetical protein